MVAPLLAIQSDPEPPVTSDDNLRTPGDSPTLAPIPLRSPGDVRVKKRKGKKAKSPSYQSRFGLFVFFANEISGDDGREVTAKTKGKKARKWGEDGAYEADGNDILDFSSAPESADAPPLPVNIDNLIGSTREQ